MRQETRIGVGILETISDHAKFHPSLLEQFFEMIFEAVRLVIHFSNRPSDGISSDTAVVKSMESASHSHTTFTFSHIQEIGKVGTKVWSSRRGLRSRVRIKAF